ncbi:hypothetical protein G6F45_014223 [Rhizopus arrhizus]|nr:hypothetical protein G6F45_014223 [Rhizopus arrhizus]
MGWPDRRGSWRRRAASCPRPRRAHARWPRPAARAKSSPNGCAAPARLRDRPECPRCSARRALHARRVAPPAAGCRPPTSHPWG